MGRCDVLIVGAGAAGLSAAIFAAERGGGLRVVIAERASKIGAKILISGGGRCNVTNREVTAADFNGRQPVVRNILAAFDEHDTVRWFESLGVPLKLEETGKLFPVSDSARTVVEALLRRCDELGVVRLTDCRIERVERSDDGFVVGHTGGAIRAARVVLASGGRSLPRTGSDGSGWQLATALGHSVTETYPALVPLLLAPEFFHAQLAGVSLPVELTTFAGDKPIDRRRGSLLFTHFGISGPVVLDASRWSARLRRPDFGGQAGDPAALPRLLCNFLPEVEVAALDARLLQAARERPRLRVASYLETLLPARLAQVLAERAGVAEVTFAELGKNQRRQLLQTLTALVLPVTGVRGWDFAEVTAGGVPLAEIDYRTMESRKAAGLYLIGEMLDVDGRIGGFNFQWAWATGYLAGRAAAGGLGA